MVITWQRKINTKIYIEIIDSPLEGANKSRVKGGPSNKNGELLKNRLEFMLKLDPSTLREAIVQENLLRDTFILNTLIVYLKVNRKEKGDLCDIAINSEMVH